MRLYIVMPVVNGLEMSQEAYASISSHTPWKFILIDQESADGHQEWGNVMSGDPNFLYIRNTPRTPLAAAWNQGVKIAFEDPECGYVALLNNDIILHPKTLDHLMAFLDKTGYLMATGDNISDRMSPETLKLLELPQPFTDFDTQEISDWRAEGPDFSCFMITRKTFEIIGSFDEHFLGAYCEDQDYHARCAMARRHALRHNDLSFPPSKIHFKRLSTAPYYHFASGTIKHADPVLRSKIAMAHGANRSYYTMKFGAEHPDVMDGHGFEQPFGDATKSWKDWQ